MNENSKKRSQMYNNNSSEDYYEDNRDVSSGDTNSENVIKPTVAGLLPDKRKLGYCITTMDAERYLQQMLDVVVNKMRECKMYEGPNIKINVSTLEAGDSFVPFSVMINTACIKDRHKKNNTGELAIFNPKDEDATVVLYEPISKMFSQFTYSKEDGKAFFSPDWKKLRGVKTSQSSKLKAIINPTIIKFNNGTVDYVTFMIDPIRLFHSMLRIQGDNEPFRVKITSWRKNAVGKFQYDVDRVLGNGDNNKKKNKNNSIAEQMNNRIRAYK